MSEDEREQMLRFGITIEQRVIYHYNGYRYEKLNNARRYAEIDANRSDERSCLSTREGF